MEPPDPGGTASPEVGQYVTIESSMDTDASVSSIKTSRKRIRPSRMCKHCNKKRRKHGRINKEHDCACSQADDTWEKCQVRLDRLPPTCKNCSASANGERNDLSHNAFSSECPERTKWDAIARSRISYC
ncbi:hypothetical protein JYU34_010111 [Plutella xylostella]|uniref:Zn(2)-C6 fungal-type domain-containing protein n=1 Tax=Plutella xylostella TaxID=51655 RepID=A0ABQ7QIZ7_PLUXY|nr:hypothetical protein JYU34_010111 [Plutella xylostella]